ncbi:MAG: prepilin-type N-terminal cleavage/methylation domain-containing protein [Acidobacteria bacterium]|nr:prepilin-type N-terminal cleavage/methylation domain-containing protein [Acidobacteriota bacterium]
MQSEKPIESHADGETTGSHSQSGFTLIETSIALIVMLVAALSAASLFVYATNYNSGANDRALAQTLAQRQMESLRKTSFDQVASSTQTVTSAGRSFTVVTTVCNDGTAGCGGSTTMKKITVVATPQSAGGAWVRSSVSLISYRADTSLGAYFQ